MEEGSTTGTRGASTTAAIHTANARVADADSDGDGDGDDAACLVSPLLQDDDGGGIRSNSDRQHLRMNHLIRPSSKNSIYHDVPPDDDDILDLIDDTMDLIDDGGDYNDDEFDFDRSRPLLPLHFLRRLPRLPPLRIVLLSLYLSFTLASFWILDSLKEPALAALVPNGDLGRHQPRAKMVSFGFVVALAMLMEYANNLSNNLSSSGGGVSSGGGGGGSAGSGGRMEMVERNADVERSTWDRRNRGDDGGICSGIFGGTGGGWQRMGIRSGRLHDLRQRWFGGGGSGDDENENDDGDDHAAGESSRITAAAFYLVGIAYIHAFVSVAAALKAQNSFGSAGEDELNEFNSIDGASTHQSSSTWSLPNRSTVLGYLLYSLIESYGSASIALFWSFANSHLTLKAAEKYYGAIIGIGQVGAIGGSALATVLGRAAGKGRTRQQSGEHGDIGEAEETGDMDENVGGTGNNSDAEVTPTLLLLACGCIGMGIVIVVIYDKLFPRPMKRPKARSNPRRRRRQGVGGGSAYEKVAITTTTTTTSMGNGSSNPRSAATATKSADLLGGLRMILRHDYLQLVLAVSVLYEIAMTCLNYEMSLIGLDRFGNYDNATVSEDGGTSNNSNNNNGNDSGITFVQFMGWYGQTVNILSLLLSFFAFPRLIRHYGLASTLRIYPTVLLLVTIAAFILLPSPNLPFLFLSLSICKALTYSIQDPSEELLYMPTSDAIKYRAKFWIDVVGTRVAKAVGSTINTYAGSVEGIVKVGSFPSVLASLALWMACYQAGMRFDGLVRRGEVVGSDDDDDGGDGEGDGDGDVEAEAEAEEVVVFDGAVDCYNSDDNGSKDKRDGKADGTFGEVDEELFSKRSHGKIQESLLL